MRAGCLNRLRVLTCEGEWRARRDSNPNCEGTDLAIATRIQNWPSDICAIDSGRNPRVRSNMKNPLLELLRREPIIECTRDMKGYYMRAGLCCQ